MGLICAILQASGILQQEKEQLKILLSASEKASAQLFTTKPNTIQTRRFSRFHALDIFAYNSGREDLMLLQGVGSDDQGFRVKARIEYAGKVDVSFAFLGYFSFYL